MNLRFTSVSAGLMLLGAAQTTSADLITVTTGFDVVDVDWTIATIEDLPGPDGAVSFSEAMIAANNTPGHDTIGFAIPEDEWQLQFLYPGRAVLTVGTGFFLNATDSVTIDGTTQTAFSGDTNPDGWEVVLYSDDINLSAAGCQLFGFDSTAVGVGGPACLIEGNSGAMNVDLFQAHGSIVRGNTGGTIKIDRSHDVIVVGNTVQRVRVWGFNASQPALNNRIGGPNPEDRNFIVGYGYVNSEGLPAGAAIQLFQTDGTIIENNSIGTTPDGMSTGNPACTMGISFETENRNVVVKDNRIAGILGVGQPPHHAGQLFGWAIYFWGSTSNIQIEGNTIGLDATGAPSLGSVWGVNVDNFGFYTVDGVSLIDNVIAGHIFNGVRVGPTATMRISGTTIFDNGWLGLDLIPDNFASGVSLNDPLDADTGGNGVQNYPVLMSAGASGPSLEVTGALHSSPSDDFTLEFFAAPACNASGFGPARMFLGSGATSTDAAGDATFAATVDSPPAGWVVTATATLEPIGATSELSACIDVIAGGDPADLDGDGAVDAADLAILLAAWGTADREADLNTDGVVDAGDLAILLAAWTG